jgi:ABC-2 type transport system ATP-binding protein
MEDIEQVCERVVIINQGSLVYDDSLEKLKRSFSNKKYIKIIFKEKQTDLDPFEKLGQVIQKGKDSITLEINKANQPEIISTILKNTHVHDIDVEGVPLSKIIESIFKQK